MNFLSDLINDRIITALGWNIFHILWQGILISIVLSLVLRILKNKSSQLRYVLSMLSLLLVLGVSVFNYIKYYEEDMPKAINTNEFNQEDAGLLFIDLNNTNLNESSTDLIALFQDSIKNIDKFFPLIVNLWIIGVFVFILKFILSFFYTSRLKRINTINLSDEWLIKFKNIKDQLKINKTITYIGSQLVKVPLVLGYLKPIVVIPVELLSGIPSNQIEAIIAHELAHIRRNDYIFNVLQTIIETVFFFHPAVWYISSQIRKERENCCDDMALTVCEGSLIYAKALVSVQEFTLNRHYSAVAFSGRKKHLLNRIKRMIMKQKVKSKITDKILAAIIILSGVLALSFTYKTSITNEISEINIPNVEVNETINTPNNEIFENTSIAKVKEVVPDTIKKRKHFHNELDIDNNTVTKTYRDEKGKKKEMQFTLDNGKVTKLLIDGNKVPEKDYDKYQDDIDETVEDLNDAKIDIREAIKDVGEIDFKEIQKEVQEALSNININYEEIQKEIEHAMQEVKDIDYEKIMKEVEINLDALKNLDFDFDFDLEDLDIDLDKIKDEIKKAKLEMEEHVDMESLQKEMMKMQEELSKVRIEEIKMQVEKEHKRFEEFDKEKIMKELEEKLEELEALELEEK